MEKFLKIKNHDGYSISNLGRVRNDKTGRILKCNINSNGYRRVALIYGKYFFIHKLVIETFHPLKQLKLIINHIDGKRLNNNLINLEYCSERYNQWHSHNILMNNNGENANGSKLTNNQDKEIRNLYKQKKYTQKKLGILYNVCTSTINYIINDKKYIK